jgi:hypothetical protein
MGQLPRIDEEPASLIETMNRDVVVERTGLSAQPVHGHRRGVLAASKQVDFYQVDFAGQGFLLLLQIQIPAFVAGCLVAQAEHLDRRHDPLVSRSQAPVGTHQGRDWSAADFTTHITVDESTARLIHGGTVEARTGHFSPDLQAVIDAWPA